nr:hypothetical protein [Streptomyces tsukubensis NRRL18488]
MAVGIAYHCDDPTVPGLGQHLAGETGGFLDGHVGAGDRDGARQQRGQLPGDTPGGLVTDGDVRLGGEGRDVRRFGDRPVRLRTGGDLDGPAGGDEPDIGQIAYDTVGSPAADAGRGPLLLAS